MTEVQAQVESDARRFLERAGEFLAAEPFLRSVIATISAAAVERPPDGAAWCVAVDRGGAVVGAAMQTLPHIIAVTDMPGVAAAAVADALHSAGRTTQVVSGEARAAGAFAARWADLSSRVPVLRRGMGIFGLDTVVDPPRPPGALRPAGPDDEPLLRDWAHAFGRDLGLNEEEALAGVDQTLSRPGLYLWEDGGPACLVGHTAAAAGVARVGPVYTPPERRRRGYAGAATAEVSRVLVAGGIRPMLYTDLANPTSNGVYQRIGYRRIGDAAEVEFVA